jgi:hypothetical protein
MTVPLQKAFIYKDQLCELVQEDRSCWRAIPVEVGSCQRHIETQVFSVMPELGIMAVDLATQIPLTTLATHVKLDKMISCTIPEPIPGAAMEFARSGGTSVVRWLLRIQHGSPLAPSLVAGIVTLAAMLDDPSWGLESYVKELSDSEFK